MKTIAIFILALFFLLASEMVAQETALNLDAEIQKMDTDIKKQEKLVTDQAAAEAPKPGSQIQPESIELKMLRQQLQILQMQKGMLMHEKKLQKLSEKMQLSQTRSGHIQNDLMAVCPIGTIVISVVNFSQFSANSKFDPKTSKWAPADGRLVAGSKFQELYGDHLPDLRGQFIVGFNPRCLAPML